MLRHTNVQSCWFDEMFVARFDRSHSHAASGCGLWAVRCVECSTRNQTLEYINNLWSLAIQNEGRIKLHLECHKFCIRFGRTISMETATTWGIIFQTIYDRIPCSLSNTLTCWHGAVYWRWKCCRTTSDIMEVPPTIPLSCLARAYF